MFEKHGKMFFDILIKLKCVSTVCSISDILTVLSFDIGTVKHVTRAV